MRLTTFLGLGLSAAVTVLAASCNPPAQPAYADISYQTRCIHRDGSAITGCTAPMQRDIYGFSGDMGQRFSCSIAETATTRTVNFNVTARVSGTPIGVALSGAVVPVAGGAPQGTSNFQWTDGNTFGGASAAVAPSAAQPCQVSNISFTTDTATGLPLMDVNVLCYDAPSIPAQSPEVLRSVTRAGNTGDEDMMPFTVHFYSCPVVHR